MIVFYHNKSKITEIVSTETGNFLNEINRNIVAVLLDFADKFKDEILVWCDESERDNLNISEIEKLFHHKKMLYSYASLNNYFDRRLGYIEDSPFIRINKEVKYATWQMSSQVGAVHASVLNVCKADLKTENNFDYFLNSFAKRALPQGLFCYSEPRLLLEKKIIKSENESNLQELFRFTKQHYKTRWVFLLFFNLLIFEKKFPLMPLVFSLFYSKRNFNPESLNHIVLESNKNLIEQATIDVLIPTIGRKDYLLNVLNNLAAQTYLPKNVIIIEQNPAENSNSDLDFVENQKWPFVIKHHFTHKTGACNARNIGLPMIESEFAFFADDDIVFENDLLEKAMQTFQQTGNEVFLVACHLESQAVIPQSPKQFTVFGAGHAFVKSACFKGLKFNTAYEFGFGEDNDFGMQLRNRGFDILYISTSEILHLKAPIGGFRTKPILKWQEDAILPKPSPTVMLFRLLYDTKEQLLNYKTTLFFKNLNKSFIFNPVKYIKLFRKKWDRSIFWANELNK
ncbi:MAG: glycosyltransferase family A protein [Flavobacterium sp.]|uniref:glycosyltransferase family 2 protein n=1 Tax=Flavobacterium sp. TaxID=239 RepID=UPI0032674885